MGVRSVIVQDQVIGTADLRVTVDGLLGIPRELRIRPFSEDFAKGFTQHSKP